MTIPEMHRNQFGGWWVDLIEVTHEGKRIVETVNFKTYREASDFWFEQMKNVVQGVAK